MRMDRLAMLIAFLATSLTPTCVFAQSAAWTKCVNHTTTNSEWGACGSAEISRQEAHLGIAWKKAFACFDKSDPSGQKTKQAFLEVQRLWIQFKESACGFYYPSKAGDLPYFGREGEVLNAPLCKATIIEDRARWLESFTNDCAGH